MFCGIFVAIIWETMTELSVIDFCKKKVDFLDLIDSIYNLKFKNSSRRGV